MTGKMTPLRQLKPLDCRVKQDPAVAAVWRQCPKGHLGRAVTPQPRDGGGAGPCLAVSPGRPWGTAVPPVPLSFVLQLRHAQHTVLLSLVFYGFTDFFSHVTQKIARDGELLHLEFHLTQLPKRISFITVNNGTEKLSTTLVGKQNSHDLMTQF